MSNTHIPSPESIVADYLRTTPCGLAPHELHFIDEYMSVRWGKKTEIKTPFPVRPEVRSRVEDACRWLDTIPDIRGVMLDEAIQAFKDKCFPRNDETFKMDWTPYAEVWMPSAWASGLEMMVCGWNRPVIRLISDAASGRYMDFPFDVGRFGTPRPPRPRPTHGSMLVQPDPGDMIINEQTNS